MRSFVRHGLVIGTCLGALLASAGCQQKKATEYVTGVSTQVTVPRDLKTVRIQVSTGGFVQFCNTYKVLEGGKVILPRSLGNYPRSSDNNDGSVTFSIVGLTQDYSLGNVENPVWADCTSAATVGSNNVRILRRSTQPYVPDHIKFLPMSLKYSCFDINCKDGQTCKGGVCVDENISKDDAEKLPDYTDGMGEGNDAGCFSTSLCMGAAIPAAPINEDNCDFAVAESADAPVLPKDTNPFRPLCSSPTDPVCTGRPCNDGRCDLLPANSPPWTGVNVEVSYDGGHTHEILDYDPVEGFFVPDPVGHPQIFRLAPNLCKLLKEFDANGDPTTGHRITSVRASGTCAGKLPTQPICNPDQLKLMTGNDKGEPPTDVAADACKVSLLKPSKSALVLVIDDTTGHSKFFTSESGQEKISDILSTLLQDPALLKTDLGVLYADDTAPNQCTTRDVTLKSAAGGFSKTFAEGITSHGTNAAATGDPFFEQPVADAFNKLRGLGPEYARRAVAIVGNRQFEKSSCGDATTTLDLVKQARKDGIYTFAARVVSDGDANSAGNVAFAGAPYTVKNDKNEDVVPYPYDAPTAAADKKSVLQAIINNLGTCLYDVEANAVPPTTATLSYADPLTAVEQKIEHLATTTPPRTAAEELAECAKTDSKGWIVDTSDAARPRVKVCGQSCSDYQKVLGNASSFTILYKQVALPVPLYSNTVECYTPPK